MYVRTAATVRGDLEAVHEKKDNKTSVDAQAFRTPSKNPPKRSGTSRLNIWTKLPKRKISRNPSSAPSSEPTPQSTGARGASSGTKRKRSSSLSHSKKSPIKMQKTSAPAGSSYSARPVFTKRS